MSAVATLKAMLMMDTSNFKAGAIDAQGSLSGLTTQLNKSGKDMVQFASVASGAGQVLQGNFGAAIFSLMAKLKGIPPIAAGVVLGLAGIAAASYQIAKAFGANTRPIDNFFKALQGKSTVDLEGTGSADDMRQARRDKQRKDREAEATADAREMRKEEARGNMEVKMRKLKGAISGETSFETGNATRNIQQNNLANQSSILDRQMAERQTELVGTNDPKRAEELGKQIQNLADQLEQNANEMKLLTAETEAAVAERARNVEKLKTDYATQKSESDASFAERMGGVSGKGIKTDSMAAVGGFIGPQRADLGVADRQMRIQQEAVKYAAEQLKTLQELKTAVESQGGTMP
jgi:hypothetical protein